LPAFLLVGFFLYRRWCDVIPCAGAMRRAAVRLRLIAADAGRPDQAAVDGRASAA
jgi:hypothetical protein